MARRTPSFAASWVHWVASGALAGALAGVLDALLIGRFAGNLHLPDSFPHLTAVQYALVGLTAGATLRIALLALPPLRGLIPHPFSVLFPLAALVVVLGIGNQYFLGGETDPSALAFDTAALAVAVGAMVGLPRLLRSFTPLSPWVGSAVRLGLLGLLLVVLLPRGGSDGGAADGGSGADAARPNVLVLMLDTLRNDFVGWSGHPRGVSPALDAVARRGTVFTHLITQAPHTKASCASFLTSLHPTSHGAVDLAGLPASALTLGEVLRDEGYQTFGASANTYISPVFGLHQGFDRLETLPLLVTNKNQFGHILRRVSRRFGSPAPIEAVRNVLLSIERRFYWTVEGDVVELDATRVGSLFLDWMDEEPREPFFAYLQVLEPHATYIPPEPYAARYSDPDYDGEPVKEHPPIAGLFAPVHTAPALPDDELRNMIDRYDAEIAHMDDQLAPLWRRLSEDGLMERTIVVLVGDHGESFFEKGMWGHGHCLYEEELRVPLVIAWPTVLPEGHLVPRVVRTVDLMPTILDLTEVEIPPAVHGVSLVDVLEGVSAGDEPPAYSEIEWSGKKSEALRKDGLKLIRTWDGDRWLFDLDADPNERINVAAERPEALEELTRQMDEFAEFLQSTRLQGAEGAGELDDATLERLKALGYVQ